MNQPGSLLPHIIADIIEQKAEQEEISELQAALGMLEVIDHNRLHLQSIVESMIAREMGTVH